MSLSLGHLEQIWRSICFKDRRYRTNWQILIEYTRSAQLVIDRTRGLRSIYQERARLVKVTQIPFTLSHNAILTTDNSRNCWQNHFESSSNRDKKKKKKEERREKKKRSHSFLSAYPVCRALAIYQRMQNELITRIINLCLRYRLLPLKYYLEMKQTYTQIKIRSLIHLVRT